MTKDGDPTKSRLAKFIDALPNWMSATSAVVVAVIAVWAVFFSPASEALVNYLHSELADRNVQISKLERREETLRLDIRDRESRLVELRRRGTLLQGNIDRLSTDRDELEDHVFRLDKERIRLEELLKEAQSHLSTAEFATVKEKLAGLLASLIVVSWPITLINEVYSAEGSRERTESLWEPYLNFMKDSVAHRLPVSDKRLGTSVLYSFEKQCSHLANSTIHIGAMRVNRGDSNSKEVIQKVERIRNNAFELGKKIEECLQRVTQK
jgi:hypothetical protein